MGRVRLHLDADTSRKALYQALLDRGHDVTRTPAEWVAGDADDETQLLAAIAQGRCIFTFNIRDYMRLAQLHPRHRGILLAAQQQWATGELIRALERFMTEIEEEDAQGQVFWLNRWR